MGKLICPTCRQVHPDVADDKCPACGGILSRNFANSDEYLREATARVLEEREQSGLDGLVKGLNCIIINTEPDKQKAAIE